MGCRPQSRFLGFLSCLVLARLVLPCLVDEDDHADDDDEDDDDDDDDGEGS